MSITDLVKTMLAAGATAEIIAVAVEAVTEASSGIKKRSSAAIRQARYRERHAGVTNVTNRNESITDVTVVTTSPSCAGSNSLFSLTEETKKTTIPKPLKSKPSADAEHPKFADFWDNRPSRGRSTNSTRDTTSQKFWKVVRSGADPDQIVAGVKRYTEMLRETGKLGTEFAQQATSILGKETWRQFLQPDTGQAPAPRKMSLAERLGELPQPIAPPG